MIYIAYILLVIGFLFLIKGADIFVDGASEIAKLLKISPMLIGLTIVAFGTSSPEAAVSIRAALNNNAGISLGNVIGSNIFNITAIVGITAILNPLSVQRDTIIKEIPFTFLTTILLLILILDAFLSKTSYNVLTRSDGLVLMCFFAIFMYYLVEIALNTKDSTPKEDTQPSSKTMGKSVVFTLGGLFGVIYGGNLVVINATKIALSLGMSQTLAGLTIISIGTSLPELITSITAALKNQSDIAVGNIVGSNIFNILFTLGISSIISDITVETKIYTDVLFLLVFTAFLFFFSGTHRKINKGEGTVLLSSYIAYTIFIVIRN